MVCMVYFADGGRTEAMVDLKEDGTPHEEVVLVLPGRTGKVKLVRVVKKDGRLSYKIRGRAKKTAAGA